MENDWFLYEIKSYDSRVSFIRNREISTLSILNEAFTFAV